MVTADSAWRGTSSRRNNTAPKKSSPRWRDVGDFMLSAGQRIEPPTSSTDVFRHHANWPAQLVHLVHQPLRFTNRLGFCFINRSRFISRRTSLALLAIFPSLLSSTLLLTIDVDVSEVFCENEIVKKQRFQRMQSSTSASLYSRYYAEACNQWRDPSPRSVPGQHSSEETMHRVQFDGLGNRTSDLPHRSNVFHLFSTTTQ